MEAVCPEAPAREGCGLRGTCKSWAVRETPAPSQTVGRADGREKGRRGAGPMPPAMSPGSFFLWAGGAVLFCGGPISLPVSREAGSF